MSDLWLCELSLSASVEFLDVLGLHSHDHPQILMFLKVTVFSGKDCVDFWDMAHCVVRKLWWQLCYVICAPVFKPAVMYKWIYPETIHVVVSLMMIIVFRRDFGNTVECVWKYCSRLVMRYSLLTTVNQTHIIFVGKTSCISFHAGGGGMLVHQNVWKTVPSAWQSNLF